MNKVVLLADSLFWHIVDPMDPAREVSFLVGTIHLADSRVAPLVDLMRKYLLSYDDIYTEAPLTIDKNSLLDNKVFVPRDSWKKYWSTHKYLKVRKILLKAFGVDIELHKSLRPMFILTMLYQKMSVNTSFIAMDQLIWEEATMGGKHVAGLESLEEQMQIMERMSIDHEYAQLAALARNVRAARKNFSRLMRYYCDQKILLLLKKTKGSLGPNKAVLLHERNQVLASRIGAIHREKPSFFSFGAAHLAGRYGVLNLLKQQGFRLCAITDHEKS